jgi:hypothetical protein
MELDKITDIEALRNICKHCMIQIKQTFETSTHVYKQGEWYYFTQDEDGIFLYLDDPQLGLSFTYDEAEEYLEW